jgi:hypothetical protein
MSFFINPRQYCSYKRFSLILLALFFVTIESKQRNAAASLTPTQPVPAKNTPVTAPKAPTKLVQKTNKPATSTKSVISDPEILNINKSVKIIDNQSGCASNKWNNSPDDACQCCLTYGEGRFGEEQSADQIIDYCVNHSKQCNSNSLTNLKQKYNAQNISSDDFLDKLYETTTVVHKMTFDHKLLGPKGMLTEKLLSEVLEQAHKEGLLKNKGFSNKKCLQIKSLGAGSGYNTAQLFLVTSTCVQSQKLLFIVKESKKGLDESTNLKKIEVYPGMQDITAPHVKKDFPTISLPFFYFSYHPHHQNVHYIATMPAAEGMVLCELLTDFRNSQTTANAERIKKAYYILGKELSNFHKRFMKPIAGKKLGITIAHGDLHCHNIFYDEKQGHFTFIDNETMVNSFGKLKTPKIDFIRLIFPPFSTDATRYEFKEMIKGVKPETYLNLTLKPFIKGYISAYEPQERKQLLADLRAIFTSDIKAAPLHFDAKNMQEIITQYINPIFDEIEKTLTK